MRASLLITFTLLIQFNLFGQYLRVYTYDTIKFETTYQFLKIGETSNNIWEIGTPSKIYFNSAYSGNFAIVTDKSKPYPKNNLSYFDLYIGLFNMGAFPNSCFFDIIHKYDTDTLKDGGFITVSHDNGKTWKNIIKDNYKMSPSTSGPFIENLYGLVDTLYNGECGFSGKSKGWIKTTFCWYDLPCSLKSAKFAEDTMIIRFNFLSDNNDNIKEGWIIDNIRIYAVDMGNYIKTNSKNDFLIAPNPVNSTTKIYLQNPENKITLEVFDNQGKIIDKEVFFNTQSIDFNRSKLKKGVYCIKISANTGLIGVKKVIIK
jgi:hypothetical protein